MIKLIFKKRCVFNGYERVVGSLTRMMDHKKANELISQGLADEYKGPWPPKEKTKINLKDLK